MGTQASPDFMISGPVYVPDQAQHFELWKLP